MVLERKEIGTYYPTYNAINMLFKILQILLKEIMAMTDNARFLISHLRNSFITSDDTGMCELII